MCEAGHSLKGQTNSLASRQRSRCSYTCDGKPLYSVPSEERERERERWEEGCDVYSEIVTSTQKRLDDTQAKSGVNGLFSQAFGVYEVLECESPKTCQGHL